MGSGVSKQAADFLVLVKTGDRHNAGTAANVFIILHDAHGNQSEEIKLDKLLHNGLKRGKTGRFPVLNKWQLLGDIKAIEILHDGAGKSEDWLVEKIEVRSGGKGGGGVAHQFFPSTLGFRPTSACATMSSIVCCLNMTHVGSSVEGNWTPCAFSTSMMGLWEQCAR